MPIYEYACCVCGHRFETLVRAGTTPQCPSCHSGDLDKQLSVFATTSTPERTGAPLPGPCASCPNAAGPGSCAFHG